MNDEPRVRRIDPQTATGELKDRYDVLIRQRGKVPNLFLVAGHSPAIAATLATHLDAVMGPGSVPQLLKELLSVRVSHINHCRY